MTNSSKAAPKRRLPAPISSEAIVVGGFYQGCTVGGFCDSLTNIFIPGPKVTVDADTKEVTGVSELPDPVQIPHLKVADEWADRDRRERRQVEVPFDRQDEVPLHDGLFLAACVGIIRHVPDAEVAEKYPKAWAARSEKFVFDPTTQAKPERSMSDLIAEHEAMLDQRRAEAVAIRDKSKTPPPPPAE